MAPSWRTDPDHLEVVVGSMDTRRCSALARADALLTRLAFRLSLHKVEAMVEVGTKVMKLACFSPARLRRSLQEAEDGAERKGHATVDDTGSAGWTFDYRISAISISSKRGRKAVLTL